MATAGSHKMCLFKAGAKVMHEVFTMAWKDWMATAGSNDSAAWHTHVHRNLQYWWSPLHIAKSLGVVRRGGQTMRKQTIWARYAKYHRIGLALNNLPVPTKVSEYIAAKTLAVALLHTSTGYRLTWLARTHLVCTMRLHGVRQLAKGGASFDAASQRDFAAPDRCGWVQRWFAQADGNISKVCRDLRFSGPLEFLSAFACTAGDSSIAKYSDEDLLARSEQICCARIACKRQWGWEGHPAVIIQRAFED